MSQKELWKRIIYKDLETSYEVSDKGRVRNSKQYIMKPRIDKYGYNTLKLYINGGGRHIRVHRVLLIAFNPIENMESMDVNHKDKNPSNNHLSNLEWCSHKENIKHSYTKERKNNSRSISQYTLDKKFMKRFESIKVANISLGRKPTHSGIIDCANRKIKTSAGFIWAYNDNDIRKCAVPKGRKINGFPKYIITEDGKLYSKKSKRFLKSRSDKDGYIVVTLCVNNKTYRKRIHIVVAQIFIPNPNQFRVVNHIDGDKTNNHFSNLEWSTISKNTIHAYETGLNSKGRTVSQYTKEWKYIRTFRSTREAGRALGNEKSFSTGISAVCRGERNFAGGYRWKYVD
jgi:hypothetical protein